MSEQIVDIMFIENNKTMRILLQKALLVPLK